MADPNPGPRRLEVYLAEVRAHLSGVADVEATEIVEELRSHVRDSAGGERELTEESVAAALERLGSPPDLAALYVTESLLARAGRSRSPWLILRSLFRWATVSVAGVFALLGLLVGYVVAGSFACAAVMKLFAPGRAGLWRTNVDHYSLRLGLGAGPLPPGEELLGWWIVPLGLVLGAGTVWLTTRLGRWCIRRYRRSAPSRGVEAMASE